MTAIHLKALFHYHYCGILMDTSTGFCRILNCPNSFPEFYYSNTNLCILHFQNREIRRRGVVGRVPAFQPGGPGSIPGGVRNFNFCPGIESVFFVFYPVLSSAEALTLCWPHIQGGPPLCICLVFWSTDCCSSYRHLTHGHLACKSRGWSPRLGEGK